MSRYYYYIISSLPNLDIEGGLIITIKDFLEICGNFLSKKDFQILLKSSISNPDEKKVNEILDGLAMKKIKKGRFYCPCRIFTGDESKDRKTICPCIWHRQEKEEKGTCCCEIFVKK